MLYHIPFDQLVEFCPSTFLFTRVGGEEYKDENRKTELPLVAENSQATLRVFQ